MQVVYVGCKASGTVLGDVPLRALDEQLCRKGS